MKTAAELQPVSIWRNVRRSALIFVSLVGVGIACVLSASPSFAQSGATSTLVGHVTDSAGAAIAGAKVTITNVATNVSEGTLTSSTGDYTVPSLIPGTYQVSVTSPGFATQVVKGVLLIVGSESRADVALQPGKVTETVNVAAQTVHLDTENAAIGQLISEKQVDDLPLNGRNFTQLILLSSGATQNGGEQGGFRQNEGNAFTIQGAWPSSNQYTLDGININDVYYQTPAVIPSIDALQEFQIQTKNYSAAYGGGASQINLSTKSGTNGLHGTLYDFFRNDALDGRGFFDSSKLPLRQNQFGYTLGGPVFIPKVYDGRNKSFFFANYEGLRSENFTTGFANVPTSDEQNGIFPVTDPIVDPVTKVPFSGNQIPQSDFSPFYQAILSSHFFPAPNNTVANQGNFRFINETPTDSDQQLYRFDQNLGSKDRFFFRYTQTNYVSSGENIGGFTQEDTHLAESSRGIAVDWTRTFSPNIVNQVRFGWLHERVPFTGAPMSASAYSSFGLQNLYPYESDLTFPSVGFSGPYSGAGGNGDAPQLYDQPSFQISDSFTWNKGSHSLSMGADIRWFHGLNLTYVTPGFNFDGSFTGDAFADMIVGYAQAAQTQQPTPFAPTVDTSNEVNFYDKQFAPWVQDDWKVTKRLTLNLGLRYDFATKPTEGTDRTFWIDPTIAGGGLYVGNKKIIDEGLGGSVYQYGGQRSPGQTQWAVFAPRVGLAYRPFDNKTVFRAGYGVFYDSSESKEANGGANYPFGLQTRLTDVQISTLFPTFPALQPATPALLSFLFITSGTIHTPYVQTWTFSAEREVFHGFKAEADYIGSNGMHLMGRVWENAPTQYDPANPTPVSSRVPYPNLGLILDHFWDFHSNYNALDLKLEHNSKNLSLLANYTWAHSLDDKTGNSGINGDASGNGPMDEYNFGLDYSNSAADIRHRFVGSFVYPLPIGKGQRWLSGMNTVANLLVGGWQTNGIFTIQTGLPFTITADDVQFLNENFGQRADLVGNPYPSGFHRSANQWFNPSAFAQPAIGAYGSSPRDYLYGPRFLSLDASLFKNVPIREMLTWQIRLEAFNALNHPNLGLPDTYEPDSQITPNSPFGAINSVANPSRIVQLAMKLIW